MLFDVNIGRLFRIIGRVVEWRFEVKWKMKLEVFCFLSGDSFF